MTLTETAYWSRTIIKYGVFFVAFLIIGRISWVVGTNVYRHFFPTPPPPPTIAYGKLPPLSLPESKKPEEGKTLSFTLELPEGELPKTPTITSVFVIQPKSAFLGALDQARKITQRMGFTKDESALSPTIYRFRHERVDKTLDINIVTGAFSINSNLYQDPDLANIGAQAQAVAVKTVRSYLSNADLFPEDFTEGEVSSLYLRLEGGALVPSISQSEANFTKVDLFRQKVNEMPTVTPQFSRANVWFIVSGTSDPARQIIGGEYHYFAINSRDSSTYPLKTAQQAWEDLKAGKGVFVSLPEDQNITVRRVYLAYYDSQEFQEFMQPIFVFEGDNAFVAYVPAVTDEYYGQ